MRTVAGILLVSAVAIPACGPRGAAELPGAAPPSACRSLVDASGRAAVPAVRWHQPSDESDRRRLAAWCDTVGPGVFAARYGLPSAPADDLAIVSWNVHVGGGRLDTLIRELRAGRLTGGTPPAGFVLLLQEVFRAGPIVPQSIAPGAPVPDRIEPRAPTGARDDVVAIAARENLALLYLPSMRNGRETGDRSEDRGNAILSTFNVADPAGVELPFIRQRRVAVAATVSGVDAARRPWQLRVVSVHLDASTGRRHLWLLTSAHRERQAEHLAAALDDESTATVVGADLNTWAGGEREPAFMVLQRLFPHAEAGSKVAGSFGLDYLFFRLPATWRTEVRTADSDFGSDHRPTVAWITMGT